MTRPEPRVATTAPEGGDGSVSGSPQRSRDAEPSGGSATSADLRAHGALAWLLGLALLARALLSFANAWSLQTRGVLFMPLEGLGLSIGSQSPFLPFLWGSIALLAGLSLMRRLWVGWLLALAAGLAYLLSGISDLALFQFGREGLPPGAWLLLVVDVAAPAFVLAGLFTVRPWFLTIARRPLRVARPRPMGPPRP